MIVEPLNIPDVPSAVKTSQNQALNYLVDIFSIETVSLHGSISIINVQSADMNYPLMTLNMKDSKLQEHNNRQQIKVLSNSEQLTSL